ncbi:MAG TPA: HNH endonuclease signature motif containing protein [Chitinophagales bacterium]|nr:HNH endonuclease signature motif containing protein [Chitinophagales bacterium]HRP40120.1 HNH endonuclease signature motif containing protein [Chitinophagales bacterium]
MAELKVPTWSEAVERAIIQLGYFATLKQIYEVAPLFKKFEGLTPHKTINERVQRDKRFYKILPGLYGLVNHLDKIPLEYQPNDFLDKELQKNVIQEEIENTSKIIQQTIRIGQEKFRRNLLEEMSFCPITGITDKRILTASHIKPWRVSNNNERLDKNNGFIFSPTIDKLFDIGLITFEDNKALLISKALDNENIKSIGIEQKKVYEYLPIENRTQYLEYHRNFIFLD